MHVMPEPGWYIAVLVVYLVGAIPFGLLIGLSRGVDIRQSGSGNIGATNLGRAVGRTWGLVGFLLDVAKGAVPVLAIGAYFGWLGEASLSTGQVTQWLVIAMAAMAGHIFPIYLKFKGGKGVATGFDALNAPWSRNEELFHNRQLGVTRASVGYVVAADKPFADEDFSVWYGLADEERRLNVNKAPLEVLERMLEEVAGLGSLDSRPLAAAIVDWRDEDDSPEKYGAEASYYKTLNPPYACRDAPFQLIEELMLVKGMTPEIYRQTSPHLTVFGTGAVNINTTTAPVLVCLGLDEGLAEDIIRFRSGPDGEAGTGDDQVFERVGEIIEQLSEGMALSRDEEAAVRHAVNSAQLTVRSDNFRGNILRTLDNQPPRVQITFVVNRNGVVRQWREL